jgi:hypothetical protein
MVYQDFLLRIGVEEEETLSLRLLASPMGQWFGEAKLEKQSPVYELSELFHQRKITALQVEQLGNLLYESIFPEKLERIFAASLANPNIRIRLRLWLVSPTLERIPWELLRHPKRDFLALDFHTPIVRHWPEYPPMTASQLPGSLKGVIATAAPHDLLPLNAEKEQEQIVSALKPLIKQQQLCVEMLPHAKRLDLLQALNKQAHFLHFIGHGWYDEETRNGGIALESETGQADFIHSDLLRDFFIGSPTRLIMLAACETQPTATATQTIIQATGSAVIGNQTQILDSSAVIFSQILYEKLAEHHSLEEAVSDARKALKISSPIPGEWAAPVLSMGFQVGDFHLLLRADDQAVNIRANVHLPSEAYYPMKKCESEIGEMLSHLENKRSCFVDGQGGIGKTALVVELARRCFRNEQKRWKHLVWTSAKQKVLMENGVVRLQDATLTFEALLDAIATQMNYPDILHHPVPQKEEKIADILAAQPCLIFVDNLETMQEAEELVRRLSQILGKSQAIITSRHRVNTNFPIFSVTGLGAEDSLYFIRREAAERNIKDILVARDKELAPIYEATEGNPLAMKLVIGQVRDMDLDWALDNLRGRTSAIYEYLFYETYKLLDPPAQDVLDFIATSTSSVPLDEIQNAFAGELDDNNLRQTLSRLINLSLVIPGQGLKKRYAVHQLTRNFVTNQLPEIWGRENP